MDPGLQPRRLLRLLGPQLLQLRDASVLGFGTRSQLPEADRHPVWARA